MDLSNSKKITSFCSDLFKEKDNQFDNYPTNTTIPLNVFSI